MFLYDLIPQALNFIQGPDDGLDKINKSIQLYLTNLITTVSKDVNDHRVSGIQNYNKKASAAYPSIISQLIITSTGIVNIGIIPELIEFFFNEKTILPFQVRIVSVLNELQKSAELRTKLQSIKKASSPEARSNRWIRIIFGLPQNHQVTDALARQAVMSALLSHPRQISKALSCFATHLKIAVLTDNLLQSCEDFKELIQTDSISRMSDGKMKTFHPIMRMHLDVTYSINLHLSGKIINPKINKDEEEVCTSLYLWQDPGIVAACKAIGIQDIPEAVLESAIDLITKISSQISITERKIDVLSLLNNIVKMNTMKVSLEVRKAVRLMQFESAICAFASETQNMLLSLWENTIAGMAEAKDDALIKKVAMQGIYQAINEKIKLMKQLSPTRKQILREAIQNEIINRIHYLYDPSLGSEKRKYTGGFVLFDCNHSSQFAEWSRVDTGTLFIKFIIDIIDSSSEKAALVAEVTQELCEHIGSPQFLKRCIELHDTKDKEFLHTTTKFDFNKSTPWTTFGGNEPRKVLDVYQQDKEKSKRHRLSAKQPLDLCVSIIKTAKGLPLEVQEGIIKDPRKSLLLEAPEHALNLKLGHPSLMSAWQTKLSALIWLERTIVKPGLEIARSPTTDEIIYKIVKFTCDKIIPEKDRKSFLEVARKINTDLSIMNYRKSLLSVVETLRHHSKETYPVASTVSRSIDQALCQTALPASLKAKLKESTLIFADTNWQDDFNHDLLFGCFINPGSGNIELWQISSDFNSFNLLKRKEWFSSDWNVVL